MSAAAQQRTIATMKNSELFGYLQQRLSEYSPRKIAQPDLAEAGVLIALTNELDPQLVLTRRAAHLSAHRGEVAFPGGKRDPEDASIVATALREAHEEVALPPACVTVVGELDQVVSRFGYLVTPVLGLISEETPLGVNEDELDAVFKVPLSFFRQPPDRYFEQGNVKIPSYDFNEFHIWGLTAMMIAEMMNNLWDANIHFNF